MDETKKLLLVILARKAAGKSTVGNFLSQNEGFYHIEGSSVFSKFINKSDEKFFASKSDYYNSLLLYNNYMLVEEKGVIPILSEHNKIVFTGARTASGINALYKAAHKNDMTMRTIWIETDRSIRYNNAIKRNRDKYINWEGFDESDLDQYAYHCLKYGALFADIVIFNNGSQTDLFEQVTNINYLNPAKESDDSFSDKLKLALYELDNTDIENYTHPVMAKEIEYISSMLKNKLNSNHFSG